jgi:hypothetical protein
MDQDQESTTRGDMACAVAALFVVTVLASAIALPAVSFSYECVRLLTLESRLVEAQCTIVGQYPGEHDVRDHVVYYLAGLVVDFTSTDGSRVVNATALADIEPDRAWLTVEQRRVFFRDHPIGSIVPCTYDSASPYDAITVSTGGVDNLMIRVAMHVLGVILTGIVPLCTVVAWMLVLIAIAIHAARWLYSRCDSMVRLCRLPWAYQILGSRPALRRHDLDDGREEDDRGL